MKSGSLHRLALVLFMVVLLPALFYSGYELSTLSTTEELIASVYQRQLDAILYSVNQYAWDVTSSWVSQLSEVAGSQELPPDTLRARITGFVSGKSALGGVAVSDTAYRLQAMVVQDPGPQTDTIAPSTVGAALRRNAEKIDRLLRYQKADYRKIEPVELDGGRLGLVFVAQSPVNGARTGMPRIILIILDEPRFIRDVLFQKLQEAAGEEFVLAAFRENAAQPMVSTSPVEVAALKQRKELWVFPRTYVGIRLQGATVEELIQARFTRNMVLIVLLDVVLALGAWFVYRSMRKEMDLVRLKSDFVSNVSHELRTPLALIRMYAETLEMGRLRSEEKKMEYYTTILQETERLTRLVNNILNFSRMEAGRKEYRKQPVQLNDVVSRVLETYGGHLEAEGFHPVVELAPGLPEIHADAEALTEAAINIIDNAMKYSGDSTYLRIATGRNGHAVTLDVEDRGIGIAPEHQDRIFETFYRVSSALVHDTKGSGLGLALVKHIIDAHDGYISVKSELGKGSIFRMEIPVSGKLPTKDEKRKMEDKA